MASCRRVGLLSRSWVLVVAFTLLQCGSAQFCSFWNNGCIDPLAQTAVAFSFPPLFLDPITLFYSFDSSSSGKGEGPMTKTAFWLGYQDHNINPHVVDTNRTSEIALRVGNLTGTPMGPNNGCDGIWGGHCSHDIKTSLQATMFQLATSGDYYHQPLATALDQFMMTPPELPSCGAPVFDVAAIPVQDFAYEEAPSQEVTVMKTGSSHHPWQVWYLDHMTDFQQASQVAVGIVSRSPSFDSHPPLSPDDIQIELVCLQAPQGPPTGSGSPEDHD
ncbi:uncharacterized protein N7484_006627 [Penicillium longicatenatum]|uniref:uncharacterized protein n=1 Tax=Penicillium longicatenatum TaxID=1561947 RepID=UPI002549300B|nr:uncharacterized protein N7484_006627 [Penicillium longicatenatum]KAJ5644120.1 hypothetical protein N7484_006627 [Penicillium longicatenatum]